MGASGLEVTEVLGKDPLSTVVESDVIPLEEEEEEHDCRPRDPQETKSGCRDWMEKEAVDGINQPFHRQVVWSPSIVYQVGCHIFHQENEVSSGILGMT